MIIIRQLNKVSTNHDMVAAYEVKPDQIRFVKESCRESFFQTLRELGLVVSTNGDGSQTAPLGYHRLFQIIFTNESAGWYLFQDLTELAKTRRLGTQDSTI